MGNDVELTAALANPSVSKITLTGPIGAGTFNVTRPVEFDLAGNNIAGTLNFVYNQVGTSKITSATPATVTTVDVNTPNGSFVQGPNVTITTLNLINVASATYTNNGTITNAVITDTDARFLNEGTVNSLTVDSNGFVTLGGRSALANVVVTKASSVNVASGTTVTNLEVNAPTTVNNAGTIATVTANANTSLTGTAPSTVTGTGTVSGDALAAPANGAVSKSGLVNVTEAGAKFLAFGLKEDSREVPSTLAEVKTYIDTTYGVDFNTDAIKVVDGQITIDGTILSTADWNKVKTNGNKAVPYRITLVQDGATAADASAKRVIKIAMYQDGKAVLNTVDNILITK